MEKNKLEQKEGAQICWNNSIIFFFLNNFFVVTFCGQKPPFVRKKGSVNKTLVHVQHKGLCLLCLVAALYNNTETGSNRKPSKTRGGVGQYACQSETGLTRFQVSLWRKTLPIQVLSAPLFSRWTFLSLKLPSKKTQDPLYPISWCSADYVQCDFAEIILVVTLFQVLFLNYKYVFKNTGISEQ